MTEHKDKSRSYLKHILALGVAVAGTAAAAGSAGAKSSPGRPAPDEILYRESEAFNRYYKSLRS